MRQEAQVLSAWVYHTGISNRGSDAGYAIFRISQPQTWRKNIMQVNPGIFKAYDIRGIYPTELNEDAAYAIGRAFVTFLKAEQVIVGRDMRLSGPQIFDALTRGIMDQGADVIDI